MRACLSDILNHRAYKEIRAEVHVTARKDGSIRGKVEIDAVHTVINNSAAALGLRLFFKILRHYRKSLIFVLLIIAMNGSPRTTRSAASDPATSSMLTAMT